jgi:protein-S-isoprenylcysteine O-methyltransferase Ste14
MEQTAPQADEADIPGVVVRPPFLVLGALVLGAAMDHLLPLTFPISRSSPAHWISATIAGLMVLGGAALVAAGIRNFVGAATPVPTSQPVRVLVTTGIHGRSRNPIYVGMLLFLVGVGLVMRSPWILLLAVPVAMTIRYGVVAREEVYLERRFSDAYRAYRARVRRWL